MSKRTAALTLALAAVAACLLWRWLTREVEQPETVTVPGLAMAEIEPDQAVHDAVRAKYDALAFGDDNGNVH